jgi:hypothetical protein
VVSPKTPWGGGWKEKQAVARQVRGWSHRQEGGERLDKDSNSPGGDARRVFRIGGWRVQGV